MAITKRVRYEVLRRDGSTCRYCGAQAPDVALTVDHVLPVALGGKDDPSNLVAACIDCNAGKTSTSPDAQLVEQIGQDAIRWAKAIENAAETLLAERDAAVERRDPFLAEWDTWTIGGKPVPLPSDWMDSVDRWLALGLPMELLTDAIQIAMRNNQVTADSTWRYMAGIIWRKVDRLQGEARGAIADADRVAAGDKDSDYARGYWAAIEEITPIRLGEIEDAYQRGWDDGVEVTRAAVVAATRPAGDPIRSGDVVAEELTTARSDEPEPEEPHGT